VEVDGSNGVVRVLDGDIPTFRPISAAEMENQQQIAAQPEKAQARQ
jgi:hypothetical protein